MTGQVLFPRLSPSRHGSLRAGLEAASASWVEFNSARLQEAYEDAGTFPTTGGRRITVQELLDLRKRCLEASSHLQASSEIERGQQFDLAIGRVLYSSTLDSRGEMGHPRVWDFLTLVLLSDVAAARFEPARGVRAGRFDGGNRRHVFQRLWRRWAALGPEVVAAGRLTEDDYVALLERRVTLERSAVAKAAASAIVDSELTGGDRREYTRVLMRQLVQISGIVAVGGEDVEHLGALFKHLDSSTRAALMPRGEARLEPAIG